MVLSLALLEPALFSVRSVQAPRPFIQAAFDLYHAGDKAGAIDTFLRGVCGPDYRVILERVLPGAFDQHAADADSFFEKEQPAMQQWSFTQEDARRITQPVLAVIGELSLRDSPITVERQDLLLSWLPNVEAYVLPDAGHLMQVQNPKNTAERLAAFFANHPLSGRTWLGARLALKTRA